MRPVNLLPPEDRRGEHAPLRAGFASYAIIGVLVVALVGVVLVIMTGNQITDSKAELASLQARQAQADLAASKLAPYQDFATLSAARSETVSSLAQTRFDWERVLNELALVIPHRVTLDSLTGSAGAGGADTGTSTSSADPSITGPSLQLAGCAEGQNGVARFLAALRDIDGVTRVGMQSSQLGEQSDAATGAAAPAPGGDATASSCQTKPSIARFEITVAFDAVPVPESATVPPTGTPTPATTTSPTPATTTSTTPATTTDDSGVAATQSEEQAAKDSADQQVSDADSGAAAVGVGN